MAHSVITEFYKIESYKELSKLSFESFGLLVANSHLEGGVQAKLKIFESLQKNLYDVIGGNAAKKYFSAFFETEKEDEDRVNGPVSDLQVLHKVDKF